MERREPTVGIYTLGCKVNQYESEAIAEAFTKAGLRVVSPSSACDVYVINTCTVTAESDRKARQFIRRAISKNPHAYILVTGCYSQVSPDAVAAISGVDYVSGNDAKLGVVQAALDLIARGKKNDTPTVAVNVPDAGGFESMSITHFDRTRAYVKIEDGCESRCTYCIIPSARGKIRSKQMEDVLAEVRALTAAGCREVVLTGIETASWGRDLEGVDLADLLCEVDRIEGIGRVRLGSLDPSLMKQAFVDRIAPLKSLAPHFHLSMQSGSDRILAAMKRKYNTKMALDGMERLRRAMPDVQFTTDMIVGFPGETEEDFESSMRFAEAAGFLMIHVFPYSKRAGTPAASMKEQIPEPIKHERVARLSQKAAEVRNTILDAQIGRVEEVLFETFANGTAKGHTKSFLEVICPSEGLCRTATLPVLIESHDGNLCHGKILPPNHSERS